MDRQLREARAHANASGVLIEGDIPILVARDSADVWRHPDIFRMDTMAGAPPDMYSDVGQNWGFPTYDWEESVLKVYFILRSYTFSGSESIVNTFTLGEPFSASSKITLTLVTLVKLPKVISSEPTADCIPGLFSLVLTAA